MSFFFNCWVEEGDEQGIRDFLYKRTQEEKGYNSDYLQYILGE